MGDYSKYIAQLNVILRDDRIYRTALSTTLASHKRRIFQSGLDASNSRIGTYDTKPAYIQGKKYPQGYSQYKAAKGRNPGYVILRDTDQMYVDYGLIVVTPGKEYGYGHQNELNYNKTQWMEAKYSKKIFFLSNEEKRLVFDTINAQLNRLLR